MCETRLGGIISGDINSVHGSVVDCRSGVRISLESLLLFDTFGMVLSATDVHQ